MLLNKCITRIRKEKAEKRCIKQSFYEKKILTNYFYYSIVWLSKYLIYKYFDAPIELSKNIYYYLIDLIMYGEWSFVRKTEKVLNELLVHLFDDILKIEEKTLQGGSLKDLSVTELHTIEAIGMYSERTMSEVAQDLKITVGTLTTAINKLIKKEYVERKRIEEDRRVVLVKLTKKGKLAFRLHEKFHNDMIRETINGLTENEEEVLISSLEKVNGFFKDKYDFLD